MYEGFDDTFACEALAKLTPLNAYGWVKHVVDRRIATALFDAAKRPTAMAPAIAANRSLLS
jgi:ADP-L-glycero-D-manno-heptose 6-epimerase